MRQAFAVCVAISMLAHLVVLGLRVAPEPPRLRAGTAGVQSAMQVRVITLGEAAIAPAGPRQSPDARSHRTQPLPPASISSKATVPVAAKAGIHDSRNKAAQDEYIPRRWLTVAPIAQTPVLLVAPAGESQTARHAGILSLFIDEEGQVRRVQADEPLLPPAFEQAAREAFMAARFAPGQLDGQRVKSRVRVEVVFDNTPVR